MTADTTPTVRYWRQPETEVAWPAEDYVISAMYRDKRWTEVYVHTAAELDAIKADAVRDAADWLDRFEGPGGRTSLYDQVGRDLIRMLRERAARLTRPSESEDRDE